MRKIHYFILALSVLFLSSCSYFSDNNVTSLASAHNKSLPPLKSPPGVKMTYDTLYPVPVKNYPQTVKQVDITPPALYTSKKS